MSSQRRQSVQWLQANIHMWQRRWKEETGASKKRSYISDVTGCNEAFSGPAWELLCVPCLTWRRTWPSTAFKKILLKCLNIHGGQVGKTQNDSQWLKFNRQCSSHGLITKLQQYTVASGHRGVELISCCWAPFGHASLLHRSAGGKTPFNWKAGSMWGGGMIFRPC